MNLSATEVSELFKVIKDHNLSITEVIGRIKGDSNSKAEEITLTVDYSKNLKEMIAAGKYDRTNSDITEKHFPLPTELNGKKVESSSKLFHFNRSISSKDAISEMDKVGYRPATLAELLALGESQPDLQRQFPIIALGSVWHHASGRRVVPGLDVDGIGRKLDLYWFDGDWGAHYRFLAVRK